MESEQKSSSTCFSVLGFFVFMAGWLDGDGMIRCLCAVIYTYIYIHSIYIYTYVWIHVEQLYIQIRQSVDETQVICICSTDDRGK